MERYCVVVSYEGRKSIVVGGPISRASAFGIARDLNEGMCEEEESRYWVAQLVPQQDYAAVDEDVEIDDLIPDTTPRI